MGLSPTQLTLRELRKRGYIAEVTERWNPWAKIRQDLFGFVDVLGVSSEGTVAIQATSYSNVSKRVEKIKNDSKSRILMSAGWQLYVWGWHKKKGRWVIREVWLNEEFLGGLVGK